MTPMAGVGPVLDGPARVRTYDEDRVRVSVLQRKSPQSRSPDCLMPRNVVTLEPESVVALRKALAGTTIAKLNLFA